LDHRPGGGNLSRSLTLNFEITRRGLDMVKTTQKAEAMAYDTGIDAVDMALKMELPEFEYSEQEPGRGSIRITVALNILFTGDMFTMITGFKRMTEERITGALTGALVELFGEGITHGGCHD
jgi:hypothetical protein